MGSRGVRELCAHPHHDGFYFDKLCHFAGRREREKNMMDFFYAPSLATPYSFSRPILFLIRLHDWISRLSILYNAVRLAGITDCEG